MWYTSDSNFTLLEIAEKDPLKNTQLVAVLLCCKRSRRRVTGAIRAENRPQISSRQQLNTVVFRGALQHVHIDQGKTTPGCYLATYSPQNKQPDNQTQLPFRFTSFIQPDFVRMLAEYFSRLKTKKANLTGYFCELIYNNLYSRVDLIHLCAAIFLSLFYMDAGR